MKTFNWVTRCATLVVGAMLIAAPVTVSGKATDKTPDSKDVPQKGTCYLPVDPKEEFSSALTRMKAAKSNAARTSTAIM